MTDILEKSLNLISGISKATKTPGKRNRTLEAIPSALNLFFTKIHNDTVSFRKPVCENPAVAQFIDQYLESLRRRWTVGDTRDEVIANASEHAVRLRFIAQQNFVGATRFNIAEFCAENLAFQTRFDEYALQSLLCQVSCSPDHFILFTNILRKRLSPSENNTSHSVALGFVLQSPLFDVEDTRDLLATLIFSLFTRSRSVLVRSKCLLCIAKAIQSRSKATSRSSRATLLSFSGSSSNHSQVAKSDVSNMVSTSLTNSDSQVEFSACCALILETCRTLNSSANDFVSETKFQLLTRVRKLRVETLLERENVQLAVRVVRTFERILVANAMALHRSDSSCCDALHKENDSIIDWLVRLMNALASATKRHQHAVLYELLRTVIHCAPFCYSNSGRQNSAKDSSAPAASAGFDWLLQRAVFCVEKLLHSQTDAALIYVALSCMNELLKAGERSRLHADSEADSNQPSAARSFFKSVRSLVSKFQSVLTAHVARLAPRRGVTSTNCDSIAVEKEARIALEILVRVTNRQNFRAVLRLFETKRVDLRYFATLFVSLIQSRALLVQFDAADERFGLLDGVLRVFSGVLNVNDVHQMASGTVLHSASDAITRACLHFSKLPQGGEAVLTFFYIDLLRCAIDERSVTCIDEVPKLETALFDYFTDFLTKLSSTDIKRVYCDATLSTLSDVFLSLTSIRRRFENGKRLSELSNLIENCELKRQFSELANARSWGLESSGRDGQSSVQAQPSQSESSNKLISPISELDFSLTFLDGIIVSYMETAVAPSPYLSSGLRLRLQANSRKELEQPMSAERAAQNLLDGVTSASPTTPPTPQAAGDLLIDLVDQRDLNNITVPAQHPEGVTASAERVGVVQKTNADVDRAAERGSTMQGQTLPTQRLSARAQQRSTMDDLFLGVDESD